MSKYENCRTLAKEAISKIDMDRLWVDAEALSKFQRFTGSEDAEKSVDMICERLSDYGVDHVREKLEVFHSHPLDGTMKVRTTNGEELLFPINPYTFTGCCDNLEAPIVMDEVGKDYSILYDPTNPATFQIAEEKRYSEFAGKIVYTLDLSVDFFLKARTAGAVAVITGMGVDDKFYGSIGGVWGTPEVDGLRLIHPFLPHANLGSTNTLKLLELMEAGKVKSVVLTIRRDTGVIHPTMPIATIKGRTDKFVLVSAHYDAWSEGMTDNGIAVVALIEMARILKQYEGKLKRGVKFVWWAGHEDAYYAGSTWLCDNYWKELNDNCVAYVNMDGAGFGDLEHVTLMTSKFEDDTFNEELLTEYNKDAPQPAGAVVRFADQSFWAVNLPFMSMPQFGEYQIGGEGYPFWHTPQDTLDKCNKLSTQRDTACLLKMLCYFVNCEQLPAAFTKYVGYMEGLLQSIQGAITEDFDLSPVYPELEKLKVAAVKLQEAMPGKEDTDDIICKAGGELVRLVNTYGTRYGQDWFEFLPFFPRLSAAMGKTRENTTPEYYLALRTSFKRQVNRLVDGMNNVVAMIECQLAQWTK